MASGQQPSIFISCVSAEFKSTRQRIANILTRLGYTPVIQEIFGLEAGDLRQILRDKIDGCEGLIQIAGKAYGVEPPGVDADVGRVSYTQFEFLYAQQRQKKTWLIIAGEGCTSDAPLDQLDLPRDPAHPDPAAYQAERRALQQAYLQSRANTGHLFHPASSDADLDLRVERLNDELKKLREAFSLWQSKVLRRIAAVFLLLFLLIGGMWLVFLRQGRTLQTIGQISEEARRVTKEKIRTQLEIAAEKTHEAALAVAEKASDWQTRQKLRDAADNEHKVRLSRIDELAASFAEIEGTSQSTSVFDEMTRVLAGEGVDQALAYVETKRSGILEKVKARAAAAREKNRAELLPLLKSAQLKATRPDRKEAADLFRDILAVDPDWPEALDAQFWFVIDEGDRAITYSTLSVASVHFTAAQGIAQHLLTLDANNAIGQRDLSVSLNRIGDVKGSQGDLAGALASYQSSLEIDRKLAAADPSSARAQRDLSVSLNRIGDVKGSQGDLAGALASYQSSLEIGRKLAAADPSSAQAQRDLSISLNKIGDVKGSQGDLAGALASYQSSLEIGRKLAAADPRSAEAQRDLSISFDRIGNVKRSQGDLAGALASYQSSLEIGRKLAAADPSSAQAQRDLSVSLNKIGDVKRSQGDLAGALASYQSSLEIRRKLAAADPSSAQAQRDLSVSFERIGNVKSSQGDLAGALVSYQSSLEIRRKLAAADPSSAQAQRDLSVSFERIGNVKSSQGDLAGALVSYQLSLETRRRLAAADPSSAEAQRDLSVSLNKIGDVKRLQGDLAGALASYQSSLEIARKLATSDPSNAEGQRDLSYSLKVIGQVYMSQQKWAEALPLLQESVAIDERLSKSDPTNAMWQKDVLESRRLVTEVQAKLKE